MLLPNRKNFVTAASLDSKILQLILLILFRRVNLSFALVEQWSRWWVEVWIIIKAETTKIAAALKVMLN